MIKRLWVWVPVGVAGTFSSPQRSTFCADLFRYLFHFHVATVAKSVWSTFCADLFRYFFHLHVATVAKSVWSTFCADLFRYLFSLHVATVACKRSRSFCQKCVWQVTAKCKCILRTSLCMKQHGCMVYTEHTKTAAVSCGTSHVSTVSTALWWIFRGKACHSCRITCKPSESAWEWRIALYKNDKQQQFSMFTGRLVFLLWVPFK